VVAVEVTNAVPCPYQGPPPGFWYGQDPAWRIPLEAAARRRYGSDLRATLTPRRLTYDLAGLQITSRADLVPVRIEFGADHSVHHYGLPAHDYPTVRADPGAKSKHRNPDGTLCLYYPGDPPERRWTCELGLLVLLNLVAEHLFAELHWWATRGSHGGEWILDEAPHGYHGSAA